MRKFSKKEIIKSGELAEIDSALVKKLLSFLEYSADLLAPPKKEVFPTKKIIEGYNDFYVHILGIAPKITIADGKSAREIASYLTGVVKSKNPIATEDDVVSAWNFILNKYYSWDKFHQKQIKLCQINSNINNIIANIKGVTNGKPTLETSLQRINEMVESGNY